MGLECLGHPTQSPQLLCSPVALHSGVLSWRQSRLPPAGGTLVLLGPAQPAGWLSRLGGQWPLDLGLQERESKQLADALRSRDGACQRCADPQPPERPTQRLDHRPCSHQCCAPAASHAGRARESQTDTPPNQPCACPAYGSHLLGPRPAASSQAVPAAGPVPGRAVHSPAGLSATAQPSAGRVCPRRARRRRLRLCSPPAGPPWLPEGPLVL